jgi:hypothetical protein
VCYNIYKPARCKSQLHNDHRHNKTRQGNINILTINTCIKTFFIILCRVLLSAGSYNNALITQMICIGPGESKICVYTCSLSEVYCRQKDFCLSSDFLQDMMLFYGDLNFYFPSQCISYQLNLY